MEKNQLAIPTEDDRSWEDYPLELRRQDPFSGMLLGPFNHWVSSGVSGKWYWDLEQLYPRAVGGVLHERPSNARVLDLDSAMSVCKALSSPFREAKIAGFQAASGGHHAWLCG